MYKNSLYYTVKIPPTIFCKLSSLKKLQLVSLKKIYRVMLCTCACVCMRAHAQKCVSAQKDQKRMLDATELVMGSREPPSVDGGNQTLIHCKSSNLTTEQSFLSH